MSIVRKNASTIVVSAVTAVVTAATVAGGPAIAAGIFANNSDKVDGFHAVGAKADAQKRAGKLVATNAKGRLPSDILVKARDAELLDGLDSSAFAGADHDHDDSYAPAGHHHDGTYAPTSHHHDDRYVRRNSALTVEVLAVRGDASIRNQSDPAASVTRIGAGRYCIVAPGSQEGAVGALQNQGFESDGTIRVTMGIGGPCPDVPGANIYVETFTGSTLADQRFSVMYPVSFG